MATGLLLIVLVAAWVGASLLFGALLIVRPLDRERKAAHQFSRLLTVLSSDEAGGQRRTRSSHP
jgi:hypothetical protein